MSNLNGQITFAINKCFSESTDKHDYKKENGKEMGDKIFSYSEKFRLKDVSRDFTSYIKENFQEVKQVKDISSDIVQNFINTKLSCTQNTINSYCSSLYKLENVLNKTYSTCNLNWRQEIVIPTVERKQSVNRGVSSVISREDYSKILEYCKENVSQSSYAVQLQDFLGIRIEEVARIKLDNVNLTNNTILIVGKGGRKIEKAIPEDKIALVKEAVSMQYDDKRLFSIEGSSINKFLNRIEDKLGLERHSNHDIRRLIAQEKFDSLREKGLTPKEAMTETSKWLSHGEDRKNLLERSYIVIH